MGFKCGIVGLPNVGKSTLFNALTRTAAAQAANYPFCTIEPNTGEVAVPDPRMQKLAAIAHSKEIIPTRISFVDIAGLVRGASKGEGLGNKFLANIREVDAVVHVLRCFEDDDITHVEGRINPVGDADTIETELMLADLESLERRVEQTRKRATGKDKDSMAQLPVMEAVIKLLNEGKPARLLLKTLGADEIEILKGLNLLTSHPVLYVCNVAEADAATGNVHTEAVAKMAAEQGAECVIISAAIEAEVAQLPDEESKEFLAALGLEEAGLDRLIRAGYHLLHLITYFTVGPKETRAWTIVRGTKAPQAAGVIHTDFERGFIRAFTIGYDDYVALGGEVAAKEAGKDNAGWIESPEDMRDRLRAEADENKDNSHYRSPLASQSTTNHNLTTAQQTAAYREGRRIQQGVYSDKRRYLSDPPLDYRRMPAEAQADLGEPEKVKERRRKKEAKAAKQTGSKWWPF